MIFCQPPAATRATLRGAAAMPLRRYADAVTAATAATYAQAAIMLMPCHVALLAIRRCFFSYALRFVTLSPQRRCLFR